MFNSWNNQRAITYRKLNGIPDDWGTAVNVQSMVFGNMGDDCATGVAFTRNPVDRREALLRRVPAERAGRGRRRRHPHAAADLEGAGGRQDEKSLEETMPEVYAQLVDVYKKLEVALPRHAGHRVHDPVAASSICCRRAPASAPASPR